MSIQKMTLVVLVMSSFLFADIKLKRANYIAKNAGKVVDIELVVPMQNTRLMVISVMKPNNKRQARDARFRNVQGYENIMLGLLSNLHHWGKVQIRSEKLIVLKNIRIVDGLTVYIGDDSLVIYKKPQKPEGWRKRVQKLESIIAAQNVRIQALEDANASILQRLQRLEQNQQPTYTRPVVFDISYDTQPVNDGYSVTATEVNNPKSTRVLKQNDTMTPGLYSIVISMPGYHTLQYDLHVEAVDSPITIQQQLQAKLRKLAFSITASSGQKLNGCRVTLTPVNSKYWSGVKEGESVKPGWYFLNIKKDGYLFEKKKIHIAPAEEAYVISEMLFGAKRQLAFNIRDKSSGAIVNPHTIVDLGTNKLVSVNTWYPTNTKVKLRFTFQEYGSVDKDIIVGSGSGPYVVDLWLNNRWRKIEFTVRYHETEMNGIKYQYSFYADGNLLEGHHVVSRNVNGYEYYTVMVPSNATHFRAQLGYKFLQVSMAEFVSGMTLGRLRQTDVTSLISHFQRLHKNGKNYEAAISALEDMLQGRRFRRRWQGMNSQDRQKFMQHLYSWRTKNGQWRIRLQIIIYALKKS
ncbi:hypothetical protein [Candidatus Uabimicrobium amorphum]|uniref:PEGA domain-containing protein n=1 Tax=Uabimicrobium amorphum TaxID=2596890 RepID=A0A5S9F6A9_UABAM|nr:hypothetical protein [Candidatus Uabimicrobium amorphum]BBM87695.1 hypothetical protein UABAM_06110 [Candidatus Uabimicrobium amorphum]